MEISRLWYMKTFLILRLVFIMTYSIFWTNYVYNHIVFQSLSTSALLLFTFYSCQHIVFVSWTIWFFNIFTTHTILILISTHCIICISGLSSTLQNSVCKSCSSLHHPASASCSLPVCLWQISWNSGPCHPGKEFTLNWYLVFDSSSELQEMANLASAEHAVKHRTCILFLFFGINSVCSVLCR